jgi:hypothetical protein
LALMFPVLSLLPAAGAGALEVLVGAAGEALLPPLPPHPVIQTVIPTKSALTDAALNSRRVSG